MWLLDGSVRRSLFAVCLITFGLSGPASAAFIYSVDDGAGESSLALGGARNIWLNAFQAVAGGEIISSIDIAFGATDQDSEVNGDPITVYLWSDPNNDGDPRDAILETSIAGVTANIHTNIFNNFAVPSSPTFGVGDWFFVGFGWLPSGSGAGFLVNRDTSPSAGASWVFGGALTDPNNLGAGVDGIDNFSPQDLDNIALGGNFLIRANGRAADVSQVPLPATVLLFGLGLAGLGWSRSTKTTKS
ncbi:MAG: PEP-CTERM sorting domain-containing protein [Pseudomonadota bacterium]